MANAPRDENGHPAILATDAVTGKTFPVLGNAETGALLIQNLGEVVPAVPAEGTYTLQSVDGELSWVIVEGA